MKKLVLTVALAACFGAAQAQTVSGTIRYDLTKAENANATSGITKSELVVKAAEDLGGGLSLSAQIGLDGAGRGETLAGTDAFVSVKSRIGSVTVGQTEAGNGIIARGYAGAPVIGADGSVLAAKSNIDSIKYEAPAIAGFTASVSGSRAVDSTADYSYSLAVSGKVGPLDAGIDYNEASSRVRASASMAVAGLTVGAGYSGRETGVADSYALGVSMPIGVMTVGATYSNGNGTAKEVGVSYALSKRTSVAVAYRTVDGNSTDATNVATSRVRLQHTF